MSEKRNRKKWYKKWYFWAISLLAVFNVFLIISLLAFFDENEKLEEKIEYISKNSSATTGHIPIEVSSESTVPEKESTVQSETKKTFKENEEAFIYDTNGNKIYSLKILKATTQLSESNEAYTDGKPENTIQVTYEYKNYNHKEPLLITSQFINAYNSDGKAGKNMSMMDGQTQVSEGKSSQTTIWFVMDKSMTNQKIVEIEYTNDFSLDFNDTIKFDIPLEH